MEEIIREELKALRSMVLTWKESYLRWASPAGESEFVVREFLEEIESYVYPYLRRLYECQYLSAAEVNEFMEFCYYQVGDLRDALRETGAEQLHGGG